MNRPALSCSARPMIPPPRSGRVPDLPAGEIRNDSFGLEIYSPYQDLELPEHAVYDCGDLELAIGSSEQVLAQIEDTTGEDHFR